MLRTVLQVSVFMVAVYHIVWGVSLLAWDSSVAWITAVNHLLNSWAFGVEWVLGAELLIAGLLALFVLTFDREIGFAGATALLPQQLLLLSASWGIIESIVASAFADGVVRPRAFIFNDQFPSLLAAGLHTGALMVEYTRDIITTVRRRLPCPTSG